MKNPDNGSCDLPLPIQEDNDKKILQFPSDNTTIKT